MRAPRLRPGDKWEITLGPWDAGVNTKTAPYKLENNELAGAANMIFDETPGTAVKRWGSQIIAALPSGLPPKYGYVFKKTNGTEHFLVSDGANLYDTTDLSSFSDPALIEGLDNTVYLQFESADDRCWMTNGSDYVMWYDGTNLVVMDREYGNAVAATADAGTDTEHIVDADLTSEEPDYWKFRKVVITSGPAAGSEAEVTAFDPATDKLTISPAITGLAEGAGYMVGLIMPKGKIIRFCEGTLFLGDTPENRSENRFNKLADIDTGYEQSIDNPRAWPTDYQLAIAQDDGDHLYSYSPVYRNRVVVSKGGSLYRVEPDATHVWRAYLISQTVGCKYPDSWAIKNELLYFLGSERGSGLLDYFMTDLVSVRPVHKDGRFIPEFANIQSGTASYKYFMRATEADFNTGEKSTLCETGGGKLECRVIDTDADWNEVITTKANLCVGDSPDGALNIVGIPPWTARYEAKKLPADDTPAWTKDLLSYTEVISAQTLRLSSTGGHAYYKKETVYDSSKNTYIAFRLWATAAAGALHHWVGIQNGVKGIIATFYNSRLLINGADVCACDISSGKILQILLDKDGNGSVYLAGARVWTGTAAAASTASATPSTPAWSANIIQFGVVGAGITIFDFVHEDNDFLYTAATLVTPLPASGTAVVKIDYKRAPAAFGKYFLQRELDVEGITDAGTDQTQIIDADRTEDDDWWIGRTVIIKSGVNAGVEGRCTAFDKETNKLSISGFTGDPGAGVKYQILKDDGTVLIQSASSDDDVDYSGWAELVNSHEPAVDNDTPLARYLKIRISLTRATWEGFTNYAKGPVIQTLTGGFLWRLLGQQIGTQISAWRNWQSDIVTPAGSSLVERVRLAKTIAAPAEGDYGALAAIVDGNNIGTVLEDNPPPAEGEGRWLDAVVEGGPGPDGTSPSLDNLTANWQEGSAAVLAVAAFMYKKRLYLTAISATSAYNDLLYVLDTNNAWTFFTGLTIFRLLAFKGLVYGLSSVNANILQHEVEGLYTDAGAAIAGQVDAGEINFGHQRAEMEYVKLGVSAAGSYEILLSYDGETWVSKGTLVFTGAETQKKRIPRGWMGKRHFIRVKSAGAEAAGITMLAAGFHAAAEV